MGALAGTRANESRNTHCEIRNVHRQRRIDPKRAVQSTEPRPREVGTRDRRVLAEQALGGRDLDRGPDEHRKPRRGHDERLDEEEPADLLWRDEHEWELSPG